MRHDYLKALCVLLSCCLSCVCRGAGLCASRRRRRAQHYTYEEEPGGTIAAEGGAQHFERGREDRGRLVAAIWLLEVGRGGHAIHRQQSDAAGRAGKPAAKSRITFAPAMGSSTPSSAPASNPRASNSRPPDSARVTEPSIFNLYTFSTTVSYVLDVFGGERRTIEGLGAQVDVQYYNVQGTYLSVVGQHCQRGRGGGGVQR